QVHTACGSSLLGKWPVGEHHCLAIETMLFTEALLTHDPRTEIDNRAGILLIPDLGEIGVRSAGHYREHTCCNGLYEILPPGHHTAPWALVSHLCRDSGTCFSRDSETETLILFLLILGLRRPHE